MPESAVLIIIFILFCYNQNVTAVDTINIGAIIDDSSRMGKETKASMILAAERFNDSSPDRKISLQFRNPGGNPLQAAYAAEELIKKKDAKAIIGMKTWEQTALVADVGKEAQVPIISFATFATTQPSTLINRWPSLFQMASDISEQIRCVTSILQSFEWRKVIAIYEVDAGGGDSGIISSLSESLQNVGVEIEDRVVLPPFSSLSKPQAFVNESLTKISSESRVFVVHLTSFSYAVHLFREAKQLGFVEKDSVWIVTEPIASLLDSVDSSVKKKMNGSLAIRTYFSAENVSGLAFTAAFQTTFRSLYPEEGRISGFGIHAPRAYDGITAIANAINSTTSSVISSTMLAKSILSSNFTGLSGQISFYEGKLSQAASILEIINVKGPVCGKLGFWFPELGFRNNLRDEGNGNGVGRNNLKVLTTAIAWPGGLTRVPKGWSMPSDGKPMKIGIPGRTSFEKFVKVTWGDINRKNYTGFCIDVFSEVLKILEQNYPLPYVFQPSNCTYEELVDAVANKTFDAVVGDVTILANRSKYVEFTLPFAESGLVIVVAKKSHGGNEAWMLLKPFTGEMWAMTGALLIYTILIVWLLERKSNPEFQGPWWDQINNALWFTCCSLFFAHKERITSNYTRAVVTVWLFVVLILTSSYTANLSSMFTIPRLEPNVTDIELLKKTNAVVGCDGDSFVRKYLEDVFRLKPQNIKNISSEYAYLEEFKCGNITAAFLELPYEKALLSDYCEGFTVAGKTANYGGDRFGGLGFVFQKGSPIAADVSRAILTLTENGRLKQLENQHFSPSSNCRPKTPEEVESLKLHGFFPLYLLFVGTSTLCFLLFTIPKLYNYWRLEKKGSENINNS